MKKKVFRERYNQEDTKITAEKAIKLIDKGIELLKDEKVKPTKRGKKNDKSNK